MKVKKIKHIVSDVPEQFYDVIDCKPAHNFPICVNSTKIFQHNCGFLDEIDFKQGGIKGTSALDTSNAIMDAYKTIKTRIVSRFTKNNVLYGRLFLVSSKKSEHDFLESYVAKMKNDRMLVVDEPQWVVKPKGTYDERTFPVAVGNRSLKSRVLADDASDEEIQAMIKQGYRIINVPFNFKHDFKLNLDSALMDIAGISVIGSVSFFNYDMFSQCYIKDYKNPFVTEVITTGIHDDLNISDFFQLDLVPSRVRMMPLFIHIDGSLTGDKTGISCVAAAGLKETKIYNGAYETTASEMVYKHIFSVAIQAPTGSEISFEKTRQFIYYLRANGFNIQAVSLDGFQSADMKQMLLTQGYDASIVSLDKTPQGYLALRSAMNDKRIGLIQLELLEKELVQLQRDVQTGKIDHPADGCFTEDTEILLYDTVHRRNFKKTIKSLYECPSVSNYYVQTVNNGNIELNRIKKVFITKHTDSLIQLIFSDNYVVECTPEHRFMLDNGEFIEAQHITKEHTLKSVHGNPVHLISRHLFKMGNQDAIRQRQEWKTPIPVYDIEVENVHNFPIGNGIVVHNSKDIADSLAGALFNATLHKQNLVDSLQIFDSILDVNSEYSPEGEFISNMEQSLANQNQRVASDKLDELINGFGGENILSW